MKNDVSPEKKADIIKDNVDNDCLDKLDIDKISEYRKILSENEGIDFFINMIL